MRREKRTSNFIAISCHASVRRYPPENWEVTTGVQLGVECASWTVDTPNSSGSAKA